MNRFKHLLSAGALVALAGLAAPAFAQVALNQVTHTGQHLDAAQAVSTSNTSAATLTLTPTSGSVYVTDVHISNCAGASAVTAAAPTSLTTTNLYGAAWQIGSGVTAGVCQPEVSDPYPLGGLKAAAPGAVTFVLPTFATNQTVRVQVTWYSAP